MDGAPAVSAAIPAAGRDRADARFEQPGDDAITGGVRGRTRRRCRALLPRRGRLGRAARAAVSAGLGRFMLVVRRTSDTLRTLFLGRSVAARYRAIPELSTRGFTQAPGMGLH